MTGRRCTALLAALAAASMGGCGDAHPEPPIEDIWRKDPDIPSTRIDISPIIDAALATC